MSFFLSRFNLLEGYKAMEKLKIHPQKPEILSSESSYEKLIAMGRNAKAGVFIMCQSIDLMRKQWQPRITVAPKFFYKMSVINEEKSKKYCEVL